MRSHANFVIALSAAVLIIGFGLIATVQASDAGPYPMSDGLFRMGIGVMIAGVAGIGGAVFLWVWTPRAQRELASDRRRNSLKTGEKLEAGRALFSPNGYARLDMQRDGNLVEVVQEWIYLWKTDTEGTGARYLTLIPDGKLVLCKPDGTEVHEIAPADGGVRLEIQNDGQLVLFRTDRSQAWRTMRAIGVAWG